MGPNIKCLYEVQLLTRRINRTSYSVQPVDQENLGYAAKCWLDPLARNFEVALWTYPKVTLYGTTLN